MKLHRMQENERGAKPSMWSSPLLTGLLALSCAGSPPSGSTPSPSPSTSPPSDVSSEKSIWNGQEQAATVRVSNDLVEIGSASVTLRPAETPYKIKEVPLELDKLSTDKAEAYEFVIKDDVEAVQLLSVLKSAAWGGHENSQLQSTKTTLHMRGDDKAEKPQAGDWERWRGAPLHVELRSDSVRVSRIRLVGAEENDTSELNLSSQDTSNLERSLNAWCPPVDSTPSENNEAQNPHPCSPFFLTLEHTAPVGALKSVLSAFDAWAVKQPRQAHALVLLHGTKEATKIAENILDRGTLGHGHIAPDRVKEVMHGASKDFDSCFQEGKQRGVDLTGTVQLGLRIEQSGAVTQVKALDESTLLDPKVQKCVIDVTSHLTFPKPVKGAINITYPIRLRY